jgi:hypothetical protein
VVFGRDDFEARHLVLAVKFLVSMAKPLPFIETVLE